MQPCYPDKTENYPSDTRFIGIRKCTQKIRYYRSPLQSNLLRWWGFRLCSTPLLLPFDTTAGAMLMKYIIESITYDDVINFKHIPGYWPFVGGINQSPVDSPHKGQWRGALMFSLICWTNGWGNNRGAGDKYEAPSRSLWRHGTEPIWPAVHICSSVGASMSIGRGKNLIICSNNYITENRRQHI